MNTFEVERVIREVIQSAPDFSNLTTPHEMSIRYGMIDPILWSLGWKTWLHWECEPDFDLGSRGRVDYALFDDNGRIAVYILVQNSYVRLRSARARMEARLRGLSYGVGVLIRGTSWEIYDLDRRSRDFDNKRVDTLVISSEGEDFPGDVAEVLSWWIEKAQWWNEEAAPASRK